MGHQTAQPDAVHPDAVDVGAARARQLLRGRVGRRRAAPAAARAAATRRAVAVAVPDGASALPGWCSSTISTLS